MGVMPCSRYGCRNILCQRMVFQGEDSVYICDECYAELCRYKATWEPPMTVGEVKVKIREFLDTDKDTHSPLEGYDEINEEFKRQTGD